MTPEQDYETMLQDVLRRVLVDAGVKKDEATLQQLAHQGAEELKLKMAGATSAPSRHMGAVEGPNNQVTELPTPPTPQEDTAEIFDAQRDVTPG